MSHGHGGHSPESQAAEIEFDRPNRYSATFNEREVTWTWCWGHLVMFQPAWWPKTSLSYVASKHLLHGFVEQLICVVPLSLYIILFDYLLVRAEISDGLKILGGLVACLFGLWIFLEGLRYGVMPLAEKIGFLLPQPVGLPCGLDNVVGPLLFFIVGTGVTMAEPSLMALQAIGAVVSVKSTPYLYYILNQASFALQVCVGVGVGFAFLIGFYKIKFELDFKKLIYPTLTIVTILSVGMVFDEDLRTMIALAWDCGAITTGEVTVPIIVGLGGGLSSEENPFSGLGLVSLGSLWPIITVQILCLILRFTVDRSDIHHVAHPLVEPWYEKDGVMELIETLKITIPLIIFFVLLIKFLFRTDLPVITLKNVLHHHSEYLRRLKRGGDVESSKFGEFNYLWPAIVATVVGLFIFNVGLNAGLALLGYDVGSDTPHLFLETDMGPPVYSYAGGLIIMLLFCWLLGYLATVAEPAMEILGTKVQTLTKGSFSKNMFIHGISFGVGVGCVLGLLKIIFRIEMLYLILPIYWLTGVLTWYSSVPMMHMAWDGGAVTTGPVTVPLVMALGIAVAVQTGSGDGFGILALASVCPITSVLLLGTLIQSPCMKPYFPSVVEHEGGDDDTNLELEKVENRASDPDEPLIRLDEDDPLKTGHFKSYGTM